MNKVSENTDRLEPLPPASKRAAGRCLVVHDDLELRLRLGALVRKAIPKLEADCLTCASFDALTHERLTAYLALLLIVEFSPTNDAEDPLARLTRSRELAPQLPIFVFARGGDERNAARTIKLGANDYWPIHSVKVGEVGAVLQPLVAPAGIPGAATAAAGAVTAW
jgi:hypothetical protein